MAHIFISYSKTDIDFARYLRHELQDKGFLVWMDETNLVPSERWWPTIEQNILSCSAFIVIMSPRSQESKWVEREILVAEEDDVNKPIFPVLLEGKRWRRLANIEYADMSAGVGASLPFELLEGLRTYVPRGADLPIPPQLPEGIGDIEGTTASAASAPTAKRFPLPAVSGILISAILMIVGLIILISPSPSEKIPKIPTPTINSTSSIATIAALSSNTPPVQIGVSTVSATKTAIPATTIAPTNTIPSTKTPIPITALLTQTVNVTLIAQTYDAISTVRSKATSLAPTQTAVAGQTVTTTLWTPTSIPTNAATPTLTPSSTPTLQLPEVFRGHTDWVRSVAFSPDSKTILTGSMDGTVRLWDIRSGQPVRTLYPGVGYVYSVAFSPDGKTILAGGSDSTVGLRDVQSGQVLHVFDGQSSYVCSVAFSPDGKTILTGSDDGTARLWDTTLR